MTRKGTRFFNRELSWLKFNERVLSEAENRANPLLERCKFLAIFESNLDEFFMVRVSGLKEQVQSGLGELSPDGLTPSGQLEAIAPITRKLKVRAARLWLRDLLPALRHEGIVLRRVGEVSARNREALSELFRREVFPLCTPLMMQPATTFPFISNRSLNLAVRLGDEGEVRLARVKVPSSLSRFIAIPGSPGQLVLLEDLIARHLKMLFPGVEITACHPFRVIRDADIEIRELEASDLIELVEQSLRLRRFGDPVLLEVSDHMPADMVSAIAKGLRLPLSDVVRLPGMLGYDALWELARSDRPELKFEPHTPQLHDHLSRSHDLFATIRRQDVLVHHPYDSFRCVEEFVGAAATDPKVVGIKMTLYRVGVESPLVESLLEAAEAGKQVAAMVELKARFDESNNLVWSKQLEEAGVHVTYGFAEMKVHCKLCMVVRREVDGLRTYVHVGTGNYNPSTARLYTDFGLFTCSPEIAADVTEMFNYLTGFSRQSSYRRLLVAPLNLREAVIERIHREIELVRQTGRGRILIKVNSLVDPEVIESLYEASQAGVRVDLIVRGVCCLRPGVPGMSETVRVVSVVGRFLEHSRLYAFENGGAWDMLIGSADVMRRNLERRIEALVPVTDRQQIAYLCDVVCDSMLKDNVKAWDLRPDGNYERRAPAQGDGPFEAQRVLMGLPASDLLSGAGIVAP